MTIISNPAAEVNPESTIFLNSFLLPYNDPMKKAETIRVEATLVNKRVSSYNAVEGLENPMDMYELDFMADGKPLSFEVSVFEFQAVEIGMQGLLVYQGYNIVSFGSWIKDFKM